jgi:predicted RecB family nuclease
MSRLEQADDLTLLPELGRAKRDALMTAFPTVKDFANGNVAAHIRGGKTAFQGIGPDTLRKLQERAQIKASNGSPYTRKPLVFPQAGLELFFDVETDPMQDVCYLHGFVVRAGAAERYVPFFADDKSQEEQAFRDAWDLIRRSQPCALYYYSPYERTTFRHLQEQYPNVCSRQDIDDLFASARSVDLYTGMVKPYTEWPTKDHSVKTLAKYLGFQWRDTNPSGAASIEWFSQWQKDRDPTQKQRILDYNEDDCIAMRVLLEGLRRLPEK